MAGLGDAWQLSLARLDIGGLGLSKHIADYYCMYNLLNRLLSPTASVPAVECRF